MGIKEICSYAKIQKDTVLHGGDLNRNVGIEEACRELSTRPCVNLLNLPVKYKDLTPQNKTVLITSGNYYLKYWPRNINESGSKPFILAGDILAPRYKMRFKDAKDFHTKAQTNPALNWIEQNCTINNMLWKVAEAHPRMMMNFTVDWSAYYKKIECKAKELDIDTHGSPFLVIPEAFEKNIK